MTRGLSGTPLPLALRKADVAHINLVLQKARGSCVLESCGLESDIALGGQIYVVSSH